jgi:replicative superfamily II helicase
MLSASKEVLKKEWKHVAPVAELQIKNIIHNLEQIAELKLNKRITEEQEKLHLTIQKESFKTILLSFEGIGIITAEKAINAAINSVKSTINKAIGWRLL